MTKLAKRFIEKGIKPDSSYYIFDTDKEDVIEKSQFILGLNSLNLYLNQIEINDIFGAIDDNNSGCITGEEYYKFIETKFNDFYKKFQTKSNEVVTYPQIEVN